MISLEEYLKQHPVPINFFGHKDQWEMEITHK
jgi:hypothetical protein